MERDNFDTEHFIDEVEKRVALWDMESPDYSNRNLKRRGWEELIEIFSEAGDSDEKKKTMGVSLQKKWKGLRDCFTREMRKNKNTPSASGASSKSAYIYLNRLMFLERSVRNKVTESNINTVPEVSTAAEQDFSEDGEDVIRPPSSQPKKKKKISAADAEFLDIIQKNITSGNQPRTSSTTESDDDKLFCLSLHKELLKVPEVNRLQTKIEIMNVLQKGQQVLYHTPLATLPEYMTEQRDYPEYSKRNTQPHQPAASFQSLPIRSIAGMTQREQREYDPAAASVSSFSNRGSYNTTRTIQRENEAYKNPTTPSPASSTLDSQESECLELFQD